MSAALDSGLAVTALHNHFAWDSPRILFMHIEGSGEEERVAQAVGQVFATLKRAIQQPSPASAAAVTIGSGTLDTDAIAQVLGTAGSSSKGVYKVTIGRRARMHDREVGKEMGVNTWTAFGGTDQLPVVDGDFAMLESEVQNVLKALRAGGVNVVAIHNRMIGESPRYVFLHYWGIGPAKELAHTLKTALETQSQN
jgi:hypothetical protein